jgi:hypothetical protein
MIASSDGYIHSLDGRLRIKIPEVKGSSTRAAGVEKSLSAVVGVENVLANPVTGNVLILYNPTLCSRDQVFDALVQATPSAASLRGSPNVSRYQAIEALGCQIIEAAVRSTVEIAVRRLIAAVL